MLKDLKFSTQSATTISRRTTENRSLRDVLRSTLREQWKRLNPGVHPLGHAIDPDSVVLSTSTPLEINVPTEALAHASARTSGSSSRHARSRALSPGSCGFRSSDRPTASDDPAALLVDPRQSAGDAA